ncbi:MAG: sugar transferase [Lachnospiraceae bacterium]|nr:sugar transferase [Lachnospiraceae bacterium]
MAIGVYLAISCVILPWIRAFKIGVDRKTSVLTAIIVGLFLVNLVEVPVSMAITGQWRFVLAFMWRYALLWIGQSLVCIILANGMIDIYKKLFPPLEILEIYGEHPNNLAMKLHGRPDKYHVAKRIHWEQIGDSFAELIKDYDAVLINDLPDEEENHILKNCYGLNKRVYFTPKLSDILVMASESLNLFDTPLYLARNSGMNGWQRFMKRCFDLFFSFIALIVLSPVMLITAIAIKLEDGGPVLFKQERCTIGGKRFKIIKFRSMIVDAEKDGKPQPAVDGDERITNVGRFIRKTRIDELPQLINILKGEMSIVGPRPERVEHVEKYTEEISEFAFRTKVKGGLTGYAQVYGKYNTSALDKLKMDLVYVMNWNLMLDIQIIFETVKILFLRESTEGFGKKASWNYEETRKGTVSDTRRVG